MRRCPRVLTVALLLALVLPWANGCQSLSSWKQVTKETRPTHKQRQADVAQHIGRQRDVAEYRSALDAYQQGDLARCRAALEPMLKRNPDHLEGQLLLAETLAADGRAAEAAEQLQAVAKRHPRDARVQYTLGMLWDAKGDSKQALECYQRAAQEEPQNEVYQISYRTAARAAGVTVPVEVAAAAAEPKGTASTEIALAGHQESAEKSDSPGANKPSGRTETKTPPAADPRLSAAVASLRQGADATALEQFRELITASGGNSQVVLSAAVAALQANRPEMAIALIMPALDQTPPSAALYRALGTAHYRRGDYSASQTALQQALSLDNSSALSYFLMGCTLSKLGQTAAAEEHFRQAQKRDPRFSLPQPAHE